MNAAAYLIDDEPHALAKEETNVHYSSKKCPLRLKEKSTPERVPLLYRNIKGKTTDIVLRL